MGFLAPLITKENPEFLNPRNSLSRKVSGGQVMPMIRIRKINPN
jgi:hypothetical protein